MDSLRLGLVALSTLLVVMAGCGLPAGDTQSPEGVYYHWLQTRELGQVDKSWAALHPEVRKLLTQWHEAEREALFYVETMYPKGSAHRETAMEILEEGGRLRLPDAKALFGHLLAGKPGKLSAMQRMGARVASTEITGDRAVLNTVGGDVITARKVGARWTISLTTDRLKALEELVAKAEANHHRAKANAGRLRGTEQP